ncbi:hypothetical protein E2C01_061445 [Portunus trituberculatus]|uniref:Uncharacterized protein n=1 Tax=Portunus trituberculatus TaxID=210409 RepID=A0A5B7H846_PORTR|nr:hypothetical protein [Portunus trituberculatus]
MTIAIKSNPHKYSIVSSPPTPCIEGSNSWRVAGSQMCSFSLTNSNIFSTSGHHIFKPFFVTSQHKQS